MKLERMKLPKLISKDRKILALSMAFFISTFILSLNYPQLTDGAIHIIYSNFIFENLIIPYSQLELNAPHVFITPPLFHILGALSKYITGFYTIVPALSGALSVYLTFKLVSLWYDRRTGFLSALGVALTPFFFLWSSRMYIESSITAGFLLTFYLYFLYRDTGKRKYLYGTFIVGGGLAALKTYGPLAAVIVFIHIFWTNREKLIKTAKNILLPLALGVIASLPWPLRNFLKTGSPLPKVTGVPYSISSPETTVSGIFLLLPTFTELWKFPVQVLGVIPMSLIKDLGRFHPSLPYLWFILPILILGLLVYGARYERENSFIWIWIISLFAVYEVQRFMSEGATSFKYRHFVTLTPVLGLFMTRAYQNIRIENKWRKLFFALLALGLFIQMFGAATVKIQHAETSWSPFVEWSNENIGEDEVIYISHWTRQVAYQLDHNYKVIAKSKKPGYIDPQGNFTEEIRQKADWVVLPDHKRYEDDREQVETAINHGVLDSGKKIEAYRDMPYGEIGRTWHIYQVLK